MKALVIRDQCLGDVLHGEPFARVVRKQYDTVCFVTEGRYLEIFDNHPEITAVDIADGFSGDIIFDLRNAYESRIGDGLSILDAYLDKYGLSASDEEKVPQVHVTNTEIADIGKILDPGDRWAVFDFGYPKGPLRRGHWPMDHWQPVLEHVQSLGYRIVLVGTNSRVFVDDSMVDINLHRQTSLRQLFAIMKVASLYVGMDSGVMHLAQSMAVPGVAVFNPRHPASTLLLPNSSIRSIHAGKGDPFPFDSMISMIEGLL